MNAADVSRPDFAPLPPGSCKHRPISNGWSQGGGLPAFSWCGYCKAYVEHDGQWIAKFTARGKSTPREVGSS